MRKVVEDGKKLRQATEVMEWFWSDHDSRKLSFTLDEEDEYARVEPCGNALVQLETGQYVGLQYAYERNAMALFVSEGESDEVIDQVLQELNLDVGQIMRASNPEWEAKSLMRRASSAAQRQDGATALMLIDMALPLLHRAGAARPNVDALLVAAEAASQAGAYGRAEVLLRAALGHAQKGDDTEQVERVNALLKTLADDRQRIPPM